MPVPSRWSGARLAGGGLRGGALFVRGRRAGGGCGVGAANRIWHAGWLEYRTGFAVEGGLVLAQRVIWILLWASWIGQGERERDARFTL
jgi:hypothetical protein